MQKKIANIIFSTRLTSILFIVFAAAMATGTLLDAGQETSPTPYTRNLIYNAWWFEAIMVFFIINFSGNIFRYRLYKKEKWATLIIHVSFLFILIGAGITRYVSFEGMMAIREGAAENTFLSRNTFITTYIDGDYEIDGVPQRLPLNYEVDFSKRLENDFKVETKYNKQPVTIELEKFIVGAEEDIVPDETGESYLKIVEAGGGGAHNHFLKVGEVQSIHNILFALNKPTEGAINLTYSDSGITIKSPFEGDVLTMATMSQSKLYKDSLQPFLLRSRYAIGNMQLVVPKPVVKGHFDIVQKSKILKNDEDGVVLKVTTGGETKTVGLLGGQGVNSAFKQMKIGGLDFAFKYGSKVLELPFKIKLNDFEAERYPGTESGYSAYSSEVTVLDEQEGDFDYKIFMNNILDHRGYRFFQSGFDPDEKGTILSVNHDYWGALITYIGYILLYIGLMAIMFVKGSRFGDLERQLEKVKNKKAKLLTVLFLCFSLSGFAQDAHEHSEGDGHNHSGPTKVQIDSILKANITPKAHADEFGRMVIQDLDGRMKPVNTYASEMLRKVSSRNDYEGFSPNQVFLSIQESPTLWYNIPLIYLERKKADSIRKIIDVDKSTKYVTLADFFTPRGEYKLSPYLDEASSTLTPNAFQRQFVKVHGRVNLLYNTIDGASLKIFPIPESVNNKWIAPSEYVMQGSKIKDSLYANFIKNGFKAYLYTLNSAKKSGDFSEASKLLDAFKKTQHKYGSEVMLSDKKIDAEINYNKYDIFKKIHLYYLLFGIIMFVALIFQIFKDKSKFVNITVVVFRGLIITVFIVHAIGLITRWYISGHAPWLDTYETMLYVAWSTMFFGLGFGRKSDLTIALTTFVVAVILIFAHKNWLDPAIANLQPVLKSYWSMIHVSIIVASYGPFILGMIIGIVVLFLMVFTTKTNKIKMDINIKELTIINEMALTVGLVMLTIGNFLGGMWANESWGRYWGWDPKETWALISIMVYAFIIHMRLVPGLRGRWLFNLLSVIALSSVLMTYFGVNFYLAGLHSYASGDQVLSFEIIGVAAVIITVLGFFSYRGYAKHYKK